MKGRLSGMALSVPTIEVSVVGLICELEKPTTHEEIRAEIKRRSEDSKKGILGYGNVALVSTNFKTCAMFCTFDSAAGMLLDDTFGELVGGGGAGGRGQGGCPPRHVD